MSPFIIALAVIPGILISYYIYRQDKYDKEPKIYLLVCFILGMVITWPAMKMEAFGASLELTEEGNFLQLLGAAFLVVGFSEELVKYLILVIFTYPLKAFDEPLDGITYSVMIGMGFATLENILYADLYGLETIILRAFTAVPAHAIFGVFMGYFVGKAKFDNANQLKYLALGLLVPILIHGLYDIFILQEYYDWIMMLATLTLFVSGFFAFRMIRQQQNISPFKHKEPAIATIKNKETKKIIAPSEESQMLDNETDNDIMSAVLNDMKEEEE